MILEELYRETTGCMPTTISPLTPAGSSRRYFRLSGQESLIGVIGTHKAENEAFIYLANHFASEGLPTPRMVAVSKDRMAYLQTDLGDTNLWSLRDDMPLLCRTMELLPFLQTKGSDSIDYARCYPVSKFDTRSVMWDLNYFKYSYLNLTDVRYSEPHLEEAMKHLASEMELLLNPQDSGLMLRDFQSRNVMVKDGEPYFIDFQGARRGPLAYDVASFIFQAKAGFTEEIRQTLTTAYINSLSTQREVSADFSRQVVLCGLVRTLQVLGAYGFRGLVEKKGHFIQSIPFALNNLRWFLETDILDHPKLRYLKSVLGDVATHPPLTFIAAPPEGLTVRVTSFSYKKGIPVDPSGNGGGFVFDCRAMDNPGRYDEYKPLTGLDAPVIDFLESRGEIQRFLSECYGLVDSAVANYLERGFTSLTVNFGCTGGRHRSVYSAQHTAQHIKEIFPQVNVILSHREQNINTVL
ncbi:MAG: phosphotransferase [Muribaculaceae bacterium]|nr:phosphotransferase [Muribaculaceae bacterium]